MKFLWSTKLVKQSLIVNELDPKYFFITWKCLSFTLNNYLSITKKIDHKNLQVQALAHVYIRKNRQQLWLIDLPQAGIQTVLFSCSGTFDSNSKQGLLCISLSCRAMLWPVNTDLASSCWYDWSTSSSQQHHVQHQLSNQWNPVQFPVTLLENNDLVFRSRFTFQNIKLVASYKPSSSFQQL